MTLVTGFLSILNQMEIHLVQNRKENRHYDHISFNVKGDENIVFSVRDQTGTSRHHGGAIVRLNVPLKLLKHHGTMASRGFRGPSIGPPLYREVRASRTTDDEYFNQAPAYFLIFF